MSIEWTRLANLGVQLRPISSVRPPGAGRYSSFSADLGSTVKLLARELNQLQARQVVLELDVRERDIRVDGWPRADARPSSPAVVLSFGSKFGPLRYATAEFSDWQDNLRAIALSMDALRAVDRYGVSKRGEQYQGWKQLPAGEDASFGLHTRQDAAAYIARLLQVDTPFVLDSPVASVRTAIKTTHPDAGGDPDTFRKVMRAKELIEA